MHEGEVWRKDGQWGWLIIERDHTAEGPFADLDKDGFPGYTVRHGIYSTKLKRPVWNTSDLCVFALAENYEQFVAAMRNNHRYLATEENLKEGLCLGKEATAETPTTVICDRCPIRTPCMLFKTGTLALIAKENPLATANLAKMAEHLCVAFCPLEALIDSTRAMLRGVIVASLKEASDVGQDHNRH